MDHIKCKLHEAINCCAQLDNLGVILLLSFASMWTVAMESVLMLRGASLRSASTSSTESPSRHNTPAEGEPGALSEGEPGAPAECEPGAPARSAGVRLSAVPLIDGAPTQPVRNCPQ